MKSFKINTVIILQKLTTYIHQETLRGSRYGSSWAKQNMIKKNCAPLLLYFSSFKNQSIRSRSTMTCFKNSEHILPRNSRDDTFFIFNVILTQKHPRTFKFPELIQSLKLLLDSTYSTQKHLLQPLLQVLRIPFKFQEPMKSFKIFNEMVTQTYIPRNILWNAHCIITMSNIQSFVL